MQIDIQHKLESDPKMKKYLYENSEWYKYLNRNPNNYKKFVSAMKDKYKLRISDKLGETIENIDLISTVLNVIKD